MKRKIIRNIKRNSGNIKTRTPLKANKNYKGKNITHLTTVTLKANGKQYTTQIQVAEPQTMLAQVINHFNLQDIPSTMVYAGETLTYNPL